MKYLKNVIWILPAILLVFAVAGCSGGGEKSAGEGAGPAATTPIPVRPAPVIAPPADEVATPIIPRDFRRDLLGPGRLERPGLGIPGGVEGGGTTVEENKGEVANDIAVSKVTDPDVHVVGGGCGAGLVCDGLWLTYSQASAAWTSKALPDMQGGVATGVAVDELGNVYITGYFTTNFSDGTTKRQAVLVKYDASGVRKWGKTLSRRNIDHWANDVVVDNLSYTVYIVGTTTADLQDGVSVYKGKYDAFVAEFDLRDGALKVIRQIGTPDNDSGVGGIVGGNNLYVGINTITSSFQKYYLTRYSIGGSFSSLAAETDKSVLTGMTLSGSDLYIVGYSVDGVQQMFARKYNASDFNKQPWERFGGYASAVNNRATGVAIDKNGNVLVPLSTYNCLYNFDHSSATSSGSTDTVVVALPVSEQKRPAGLALDKDYNIYVVGGVMEVGLPTKVIVEKFNSALVSQGIYIH